MALLRHLVLAVALATTGATQAGRPCDDAPMTAQAVARGMALAERTRAALESSGAQVLLLARAGQDLSAYQLR